MAAITLCLIKPEDYFKHVVKILKSEHDGEIIYVTTHRPARILIDSFKSNKMSTDRFFFIDCISKTVGDASADYSTVGGPPINNAPNCAFLDSPQNLPELGISIIEKVNSLKGKRILLLDSLSTLLLYNDSATVGKFSNFLTNKMRVLGVKTIVLALESDSDKDMIQQIKSFADEVR